MTNIKLNKKELEKNIGRKPDNETEERMNMFGTPVESSDESEIELEISPNRPDLLSMQGFSRAFSQYIGKKKPYMMKVKKPDKDYKVKVDKSVRDVRPYTACAIVRGLRLNDEKIKEIVEIQEKLHLTLGRKRKKAAIGIYPMEKIKLPIRFMAKKPRDIRFVPLESPMGREMDAIQILNQHPAGREYAHLLDGLEKYPVFVDSSEKGGKILSMPPIINSQETGKITEKTRDVFIECSGFNLYYLKKTLNILVSAFYDMGGKICSMEILHPDVSKGKFISADLSAEKVEFNMDDINKTFGLDLNEKQSRECLEKMGIKTEKEKLKNEVKYYALVPPYRLDVMHWVDLAEDVAIAYGYDKIEAEPPETNAVVTTGQENLKEKEKRTVREILSGLGLLEVSSYHLASKKDVKKIYFDFSKDNFIEVEESKTDYSVLRPGLLCNLMKILSENSHAPYPQKLFEVGKIFEKDRSDESNHKILERNKLGIVLCDENIRFTEIKQVLEYMFKMLNIEYEIKEVDDINYFISGRVGKIVIKKDGEALDIGIIGEISPQVLKNFKLGLPVVALELDFDKLFS